MNCHPTNFIESNQNNALSSIMNSKQFNTPLFTQDLEYMKKNFNNIINKIDKTVLNKNYFGHSQKIKEKFSKDCKGIYNL